MAFNPPFFPLINPSGIEADQNSPKSIRLVDQDWSYFTKDLGLGNESKKKSWYDVAEEECVKEEQVRSEQQQNLETDEKDISDEEMLARMCKIKMHTKPSKPRSELKSTTTSTSKKTTQPTHKSCFKCGSSKTVALFEFEYAKFKPLCKNCTDWVEAKKNFTPPKDNFFLIRCDICKSMEQMGMFMIKPGIFKPRCQTCAKQ